MILYELLIICFFCFFQSIFGVGLLIFGTPIFLMLGYNYFEVLNILLPYSIIISFLQIIYKKDKDILFAVKFLKFSIPFLIISLIFLKYFHHNIDFILLVSFILIIFSSLNIFLFKKNNFKIKNINLALIFLGILHGFTNLGGTLLAIIASNISKNKDTILYYIANGYLIFAIFQLLFINIFFEKLNLFNLKYIWLPIIIFLLSRIIFNKIENVIFYKLLNIFTLLYGIYILINSIILYF